GTAIESRLRGSLARDPDLSLRLVEPGASPSAGDDAGPSVIAAMVPLAYADERRAPAGAGPRDSARLVVSRSPGALAALRRDIDRWFLAAFAATVALAIAGAWWLSSRVSRPLTELAARTAAIDFDRLDQSFPAERGDEIGALSATLGAMTERLRLGAARLREAERRMATGDLARQVNHDIKNGLAPIRHVLRHLHQVADQEPANLAAIYRERQGTLESSVDYLEKLAQHYARLSPALDRSSTAVNAILGDIALALKGQSATVQTNLAPDLPPVRADAVVLRRIMENLARNAVDALDGNPGVVRLSSKVVGDETATRIQIGVQDTGRGMNAEELNRAFDDFYTTKAEGTGLGLSVVRRLVTDLGGTLRVETAPSRGSHFIVELPVA
ncbi:MAG: HAMP domain-containing sensor histidine kinase, partial [Gemmatimonadota bacterium]